MGAREWDQIVAGYPSATVFHTSGWHESLNASLPGRVVRLEIRCRGSACGHWCGFLVSRFGLRLFGAPLPGTGTDYMYPLSIEPLETGQFLDALRAWAAQTRLSMVDIGGEYLDDDVLRSHGFRLRPTRTYRVDLAGGEAGVWARLKPAMRNKVRKAEKQGVVVDVDASSAFSPLFFEMLEAVFRRQNKVPTYSLRRIEAVVRGLQAAGAVVPLVAKLNGEALASVILLLDAKGLVAFANREPADRVTREIHGNEGFC